MMPDRVSNPGPLTYESDALPIALRGPANLSLKSCCCLHHGMGSHIGNILRYIVTAPYSFGNDFCDLLFASNLKRKFEIG